MRDREIQPRGPVLAARYQGLLEELRGFGRVLVAFSGGADSAFLLKAATEALGSGARGAIGVSPSLQRESLVVARWVAKSLEVVLLELEPREMDNPRYVANGPDRCFHCKDALYSLLSRVSNAAESEVVLDGTNLDDLQDHRPGRAAAAALGVRSPLAELGWGKSEIREMSRALGLPTWNRPASPCLSSRIPHGTSVTVAALQQIEEAERRVLAHGFDDVRVRHHGAVARVEVPVADLPRLVDLWPVVLQGLLDCGYETALMETAGYRRGGASGSGQTLNSREPAAVGADPTDEDRG